MTFALRLDGKTIAEVDEQVTGVRLLTPRGQAAATGLSLGDGVVDIVLDKVAPGGPPRLDQIEAQAVQQMRERAVEGVPVGAVPDAIRMGDIGGVTANQGLHLETLRPGGVDSEEVRSVVQTHPTRDLFDGLDPGDSETRTRRIDAFVDHGDPERAIADNPPGGGPQEVAFDSASFQGEPLEGEAIAPREDFDLNLGTDTTTELE